jgi:hypothetical protein
MYIDVDPCLHTHTLPTIIGDPAPGDALEAYCDGLGLWRRPHEEEARRPPQPMLWRLVHLPRLHGALPRNFLQVSYGMRLSTLTRLQHAPL